MKQILKWKRFLELISELRLLGTKKELFESEKVTELQDCLLILTDLVFWADHRQYLQILNDFINRQIDSYELLENLEYVYELNLDLSKKLYELDPNNNDQLLKLTNFVTSLYALDRKDAYLIQNLSKCNLDDEIEFSNLNFSKFFSLIDSLLITIKIYPFNINTDLNYRKKREEVLRMEIETKYFPAIAKRCEEF